MLRVDALSVVPDSQPKLPFIIPNFHFYLARLCVPECISQRLTRNPVDFISEYWMQVPWGAFHRYLTDGGIPVGFIGREFFSECGYSHGKIVGHDRGGAQPLHSIPALCDRLSGLIDSALQCLPRFLRTLRQQVSRRLKTQQQSMKTLQQRIVQVPCDTCSLADAGFQAHVELPR